MFNSKKKGIVEAKSKDLDESDVARAKGIIDDLFAGEDGLIVVLKKSKTKDGTTLSGMSYASGMSAEERASVLPAMKLDASAVLAKMLAEKFDGIGKK